MLQNVTRLVFVEHVLELSTQKGSPRSTMRPSGPMLQEYRRRYRKLRPLKKLELADREEQNLIVINYALLPKLYKYIRSFFTRYYTWYNIQSTLIDQINRYLEQTQRQQFIQITMPSVLPTLMSLRKAELRQTRDALEPFNTTEALTFLDLWTWLGPHREKSLLSKIKTQDLSRVNLVFREVGTFMVVNLGVLNGWRKDTTTEERTGIDPKTFQLRFMKTLTVLHETATLGGDDTHEKPEVLEPAQGEDAGVPTQAEMGSELSDQELEKQLDELDEPLDEEALQDLEALDAVVTTDEETVEYDEDGEVVESDEPVAEKRPSLPVPVAIDQQRPRTHSSAIETKIDQLADEGLLSGGEYRRMMRLASAYKNIQDPYGTGKSLEEAMVIKPEDVIITDPEPFPDSPEILDKSMLKSTVASFDEQYVQNVLPKDILGAVMSVQQAGVAVTSYSIERVTDAVSDFEVHAVTLVPVIGRQSTIRFRVPRINPDGSYMSNGVRYRMRKQRSDLPIRKVSPIRIALSSYYSKAFVEKSERSVFNYDRWLSQNIVAKGADPRDESITEIRISDVSDDSVRLPRVYSILSSRVASFKASGMQFFFDYKNRFKTMFNGNDAVYERDGMVLVGREGTQPILIDENDVFYRVNGDDLQVLGHAEDLFDLPADKAPPPMAEVKIFAKVIPAGVVLSYLMGFSALLETLGVTPRRVPNGQRLQLMPDEYTLRFLDESLVFSKEDVKATLILSGFNLYHSSIRHFSVHAFDKKDIYLNLLDSYGIGVRYLREMDLMNAMFIDPITREILEWMKEPTEFVPLIIRACEMLVTRHVPEKVETAEGMVEGMERARGYERVAGAVYGQLVRSIREYNRKTAVSTSTISMNPHDVWVSIVQDPAANTINEINPVHNLKEKEVITYGGRGGRSRRSMVAENRLYKDSDMGFISEATVDSSDVAIITYVPPNALFTTVRGTVRSYDPARDGTSALLSSAAQLAPAADRDDPKRVNISSLAS